MSELRAEVDFPLTHKYTFARVFSDPNNARPLLEDILGVPIGDIRLVEPEHVIEPSLRGRGVRMDVFADDGSGTVYDVEMQNDAEGDLFLRSRYLLSSFDRDRIGRRVPYQLLGRSVVIFICGFDPIGMGWRKYVVRPAVEGSDRVFDDGTMRVFLNAHGAADDSAAGGQVGSARLASFLSYIDGGGTMGNEWVERLDREVRALNADEGWRDAMLGLEMDIIADKYRAREEGLAEGREAGLAEGREAGLAEGLAEGRRAGAEDADRANARLTEALMAAGRLDELPAAMLDPRVRDQLLAEFGIAGSADE